MAYDPFSIYVYLSKTLRLLAMSEYSISPRTQFSYMNLQPLDGFPQCWAIVVLSEGSQNICISTGGKKVKYIKQRKGKVESVLPPS
jgi:hypothetical protein